MKVLTFDGRVLGGAAGLLEVARHYRWTAAIVAGGRTRLGFWLCHRFYSVIASLRPCAKGACQARRSTPGRGWDWLPLLLLPFLAAVLSWNQPSWILMWTMSFALWFGVKWLTWRDARRALGSTSWRRTLGYFLGWPGTDARAFMDATRAVARPARTEWRASLAEALAGAGLVWGLAPTILTISTVLGTWVALCGLVLLLHFGTFHLMALLWQRVGVDAAPLMRQPARATSLEEFWGRRWNTGFSVPARRFLLQPLLRPIGRVRATWAVFLVSGLIHELVISLPAQAGYGLPTAYFLIQGAAVSFERTRLARQLGLGRGFRGWLLTCVCTVAPVYGLFHPAFLHHVILPFLGVIGAT